MNAVRTALVAHGWRRAWILDTEYTPVTAGLQIPLCLCALDIITLERRNIWLTPGIACPFEMTGDELFILFAADADALTFIAMDWPTPLNVLDPRLEWMRIDNGGDQFESNSNKKKGYGLLDAARTFHLPSAPVRVKKFWQDRAARGGLFTEEEKVGLLHYCRTDVDLTARVLMAIWDEAGLSDQRTLKQATTFRGRYMAAAARIYITAIPLHMPSVKRLIHYAGVARLGLIRNISNRFPVYRPDGTFSHKLFAKFLQSRSQLARWPRTPTGMLSVSEETFEAMAEEWQLAGELQRFRIFIDQLKTFDLPIGEDGRARTALWAYGTKTGRNNTAKGGGFIFAKDAVFRHLIQPPKGRALILVDWSAQELHIAAYLSRDPRLIEIVTSGKDPYIQLAVVVGLAPEGATEESNPEARGVGKILQLAMLYGAGPSLIARATGMSLEQARAFLQRQRQVFRRFFAWSDRKAMKAVTCKPLTTPLGWTIRFRPGSSTKSPERTGRNFCVQGTAADMMRLLMMRLTERDVAVCAAVHDGFLLESDVDKADAVESMVKATMDKCAIDLIGASIPVKSRIFRWPETYHEGKTASAEMFATVLKLVAEAEAEERAKAGRQFGQLAGQNKG